MLKKLPPHRKFALGLLVVSIVIFVIFVTPFKFKLPFPSIVIESKSAQAGFYQVFYDAGSKFNEEDSSTKYVEKDERQFKQTLFKISPDTERIRIDPGSMPSELFIKSIKLKYGYVTTYVWTPEDILKNYSFNKHIEVFEIRDGDLYIKVIGSDPSFWTKTKIAKMSNGYVHLYLLLACQLLAVLLFFSSTLYQRLCRLAKTFQILKIFFAISLTPVLVLISSSNALYIGNQEILGHQVNVLSPFFNYCLLSIVCGGLLYLFYYLKSNKISKYLIWLFFLVGPSFLLFQSLRKFLVFLDTVPGVVLFLIAMGGVVLFFSRSKEPRRAVNLLWIIGCLLAGYEGYLFVTGVSIAGVQSQPSMKTVQTVDAVSDSRILPNIYHIVLDEYQTDMFINTMTPELEKELAGFVHFPNNSSNYGGTGLSIPSVFVGRSMRNNFGDYHRAAFQAGPSMLNALKSVGYDLYGFIFDLERFYPVSLPLFDHVTNIVDELLVKRIGNQSETFKRLWLYRNVPGFIAKKFISEDEFQALANQKSMPNQFGIMSVNAFKNYIQYEKKLPGKNRYTFLHLILPHRPYIFCPDCLYTMGDKDIKMTSMDEQAQCANFLTVQFIKCLKELNRFDNSIIVIHADHGRRENLEDITSFSLAKDASQALLLIKPQARNASQPFKINHFESMLIDVPATILETAGIELLPSFEGLPLFDVNTLKVKRDRSFMIYDADKFVFYDIKNGQITFSRIIEH